MGFEINVRPFIISYMCRFIAYQGPSLLMADLVTRPSHSLIHQSYHAKERKEPLNGDGFGVGWYLPELEEEPAIFTSLTPAWSNRNLHRLAEKISSPLMFAHVRAATSGIGISDMNCHPFQSGRFLWMHNGQIAQFNKIKRDLIEALGDKYFFEISGTTDSEYIFALFLSQLDRVSESSSPETLLAAIQQTIACLNKWSQEKGISETSFYNFAVSDGKRIIVTRYASNQEIEAASLYYSVGARFVCKDRICEMLSVNSSQATFLVASEPITQVADDWRSVPNNHVLIHRGGAEPELLPIG